jgi:hypothetical protein
VNPAIRTLCVAALAIAGVCALVELYLLIRDVRTDLKTQSASLHAILATTDAAAAQLLAASAQAELAAQEERAYFAKTSLEAYKTAAAARLVLVRTDHSLNDVLVPEMTASLAATDQLLQQSAADLNSTTVAITPTLLNLTQASASAADAMANPHIAETLANVDAATKNVASTSQHVDEMSVMVEKRLRQLLKPATLAERLFERLAGLGITAYGVAK